MMRILCVSVLVLSLMIVAGSARAQTATPAVAPASDSDWPIVGDQVVQSLAHATRSNITKALMPDGKTVPPETAAEITHPIIPLDDERRVVKRGLVSIYADWCGFDWKRQSGEPFMAAEQAKKTWTDKQIAYINLLHTMTVGVLSQYIKKGNCSEAIKQETAKHLLAP